MQRCIGFLKCRSHHKKGVSQHLYLFSNIFYDRIYKKNTFVVFWKRSSYFNRIGGQDYVNGN